MAVRLILPILLFLTVTLSVTALSAESTYATVPDSILNTRARIVNYIKSRINQTRVYARYVYSRTAEETRAAKTAVDAMHSKAERAKNRAGSGQVTGTKATDTFISNDSIAQRRNAVDFIDPDQFKFPPDEIEEIKGEIKEFVDRDIDELDRRIDDLERRGTPGDARKVRQLRAQQSALRSEVEALKSGRKIVTSRSGQKGFITLPSRKDMSLPNPGRAAGIVVGGLVAAAELNRGFEESADYTMQRFDEHLKTDIGQRACVDEGWTASCSTWLLREALVNGVTYTLNGMVDQGAVEEDVRQWLQSDVECANAFTGCSDPDGLSIDPIAALSTNDGCVNGWSATCQERMEFVERTSILSQFVPGGGLLMDILYPPDTSHFDERLPGGVRDVVDLDSGVVSTDIDNERDAGIDEPPMVAEYEPGEITATPEYEPGEITVTGLPEVREPFATADGSAMASSPDSYPYSGVPEQSDTDLAAGGMNGAAGPGFSSVPVQKDPFSDLTNGAGGMNGAAGPGFIGNPDHPNGGSGGDSGSSPDGYFIETESPPVEQGEPGKITVTGLPEVREPFATPDGSAMASSPDSYPYSGVPEQSDTDLAAGGTYVRNSDEAYSAAKQTEVSIKTQYDIKQISGAPFSPNVADSLSSNFHEKINVDNFETGTKVSFEQTPGAGGTVTVTDRIGETTVNLPENWREATVTTQDGTKYTFERGVETLNSTLTTEKPNGQVETLGGFTEQSVPERNYSIDSHPSLDRQSVDWVAGEKDAPTGARIDGRHNEMGARPSDLTNGGPTSINSGHGYSSDQKGPNRELSDGPGSSNQGAPPPKPQSSPTRSGTGDGASQPPVVSSQPPNHSPHASITPSDKLSSQGTSLWRLRGQTVHRAS